MYCFRLQEKLLQLREDKKLLNLQCAALDKQQQKQAAQTQIISKPSSLPASSSSNEDLKPPPATMNISHSRNFTVKQNNNDKRSSNFLPRTQTNAPVLASRKHVSFYCYQEIEEGRDLQFVHKGDEKSFSRHSVDTQVLEANDEDLQETKVTLQRNCSPHDHEESDARVFRENIKATNYSPLKDYYTDAQDQSNQVMKRIDSHGDNVMPSFKRNTSFYCYEDAQLDEQSNTLVVPFKRNRYSHVNQSEDGVRIQGTSVRLPLLPENSKNRLNLVESFITKNNLDIYSQPYNLIPTLEKKTIDENLEESQSFGSNKGQLNSPIVTAPKSSQKLNKCFVPRVPSKILSKIKIREKHKAQLERDISNIVSQANTLHH
uniref:Uncharacterized protein n=1 Tax=Timema cristinae TaxID=61476 RepID=A0A7R9D9Q2_TIMCR|nr:unnamed protein product [Timema cristinae]